MNTLQVEAGVDYALTQRGDVFEATNHAQDFTLNFNRSGVEVVPHSGKATLALHLSSYGHGADQIPVAAADMKAMANRIEYQSGPLVTWYTNGPFGLQQGFTLAEPPSSDRGTLTFVIESSLLPTSFDDGHAVRFNDQYGKPSLRYEGLYVYDSTQQALPARITVNGTKFMIVVDDTGAVYPLTVDPYIQQVELTPNDPADGNQMGYTIDTSNTLTMIGVPGDADRGANSGSVYIFRRKDVQGVSSWSKEAKLVAPDAAAGNHFGEAIYASDDLVVVGAPGRNNGQGAAYVYERKSVGIGDSYAWKLTATLSAPDGASGDEFGKAVSYSGAGTNLYRLAVSAPGKGAIYVYERDHTIAVPVWEYKTTLMAADGAPGDQFGASLLILYGNSGAFIAVGAPGDDDMGDESGSLYIFHADTIPAVWSQEVKLTAADGLAGDNLGQAIGTMLYTNSNLIILGGAPNADTAAGADAGAVYSFLRNDFTGLWSQEAKLTASDGAAGDQFGHQMDNYINWFAVIGAPGDDDRGVDAGAAYVFNYAYSSYVWTQWKKVTGVNSSAGSGYGWGVAAMANFVLASAPFESAEGSSQSGLVYVQQYNGGLWNYHSTVTAANTPANDLFGSAFAIDGDLAIVGAVGDADGGTIVGEGAAGSAYIFARSAGVWTQQTKLMPSDAYNKGRYGLKVAISGETAIVSGGGAGYIYARQGSDWIEQAHLDGGSLVAIDGDTAVIAGNGNRTFYQRTGSTWNVQNVFSGTATSVAMAGDWTVFGDPNYGSEGGAQVYHWNGTAWQLVTTLVPPVSDYTKRSFGRAVDISGTTIVVGANQFTPSSDDHDAGAVYVYTYADNKWNFQQRLVETPANPYIDGVGTSVAVEGDRVATGTGNHAYLFRYRNGQWQQVQRLLGADGASFGAGVALDNGELWITAQTSAVAGAANAGKVFGYHYSPDTDLNLDMMDDPYDPVIGGFGMIYRIVVRNSGQENTTNVILTDTLPAQVTFETASSGCVNSGQEVTCTVGDLAVGATATVEIAVQVAANASSPITNQATVTSSLTDTNPSDNTVTETTAVIAPAGTPQLLEPANGSVTTSNRPTFRWTPITNAYTYQVQLDVVNPPNGAYTGFNVGATFTPPAPLFYTTYYWRVRTIDLRGIPSPWSETRTLVVNAPLTAAPSRNAYTTDTPTLTWNPVSWATGYEVQFSADSAFSTFVASSGTLSASTLSYTATIEGKGLPNATWYWRLRVLKPDGVTWTPWGPTESFCVIFTGGPGLLAASPAQTRFAPIYGTSSTASYSGWMFSKIGSN